MNCAYCKHNGGAVYTSLPPKYRCTITNEFHLALDDCDVEFEPVKHGRWINIYGWVHCSVCHQEPPNESNIESDYCPNCGARMDEMTE